MRDHLNAIGSSLSLTETGILLAFTEGLETDCH
jgi:hypothetical protein